MSSRKQHTAPQRGSVRTESLACPGERLRDMMSPFLIGEGVLHALSTLHLSHDQRTSHALSSDRTLHDSALARADGRLP
jgi:hypothetical protein